MQRAGDDTEHIYKEILEYHPSSGEWRQLDSMMEARYYHAVSSIPISEVIQFCN